MERVPLYKFDGEPLSEKDMVDLFEAMFAFLERKGDKLSIEQKQQAICTLLDRMKITNTKSAIEKEKQKETGTQSQQREDKSPNKM